MKLTIRVGRTDGYFQAVSKLELEEGERKELLSLHCDILSSAIRELDDIPDLVAFVSGGNGRDSGETSQTRPTYGDLCSEITVITKDPWQIQKVEGIFEIVSNRLARRINSSPAGLNPLHTGRQKVQVTRKYE